MNIPESSRLVKVAEVATFLSLRPYTIRSLQKRGLPYYKVGRSVRYDLAAVRSWLDAQQRESVN